MPVSKIPTQILAINPALIVSPMSECFLVAKSIPISGVSPYENPMLHMMTTLNMLTQKDDAARASVVYFPTMILSANDTTIFPT